MPQDTAHHPEPAAGAPAPTTENGLGMPADRIGAAGGHPPSGVAVADIAGRSPEATARIDVTGNVADNGLARPVTPSRTGSPADRTAGVTDHSGPRPVAAANDLHRSSMVATRFGEAAAASDAGGSEIAGVSSVVGCARLRPYGDDETAAASSAGDSEIEGVSSVADRERLRHHGDAEARPGMVDFAVNVQGDAPPEWLRERLARRLGDLGRYPDAGEELAVRELVAARHGRRAEEVLLLAGVAEGFAMLPRLGAKLAAVIHPSFTEPELALREGGVPVARVVLEPPYLLDAALVPEDADLVVVGNPTNPTSVLHPAASLLALRRPGRLVVVDEAFTDAVVGEPETLAGKDFEDLLVFRSLTKTWALAGLRCGYALGAPEVLARLNHGRPHWPLSTLQLEAIAATAEPQAVAEAQRKAEIIAAHRDAMIPRLRELGIEVHEPAAGPYLWIRVPDAELLRKRLADKGIAVRRGDTFPGADTGHLRLAVREPARVDLLVTAIREVGL